MILSGVFRYGSDGAISSIINAVECSLHKILVEKHEWNHFSAKNARHY